MGDRIFFVCGVLAFTLCGVARADEATTRPAVHVDHKGLVKLGWQLACRVSDDSSVDVIRTLHESTIHHIELVGNQPSTHGTDALVLQAFHMDAVSYDVGNLANDPTHARQLFEFASKLKAKNIVASPAADALEMLDGLANEYRINLAIVNSVKPGPYWEPDAMLAALSGRSGRVGVCADIGNWKRSGLDPMQSLEKLDGHLIEVHLSDVNEDDELSWLKAQKFKGVFAAQCGSGGDVLGKDFVTTVNAFSDQVTRLASEGTGTR